MNEAPFDAGDKRQRDFKTVASALYASLPLHHETNARQKVVIAADIAPLSFPLSTRQVRPRLGVKLAQFSLSADPL